MSTHPNVRFVLSAALAGLVTLTGAGQVPAQEPPQQQEPAAEAPATAQPAEAQEETQAAEAPQETSQEDQGRGFTFRIDPVVIGVLETDVDTDSSKLEEYRDLDSGFLFALDLEGESEGGERAFGFETANTGRDDARYTLTYGLEGRYGIVIDYNKIPHRFGNNGRMLWSQTRPGVYEIADPVQQQIQDAVTEQFLTNRTGLNFQFLDTLLAPYIAASQTVDLALQRDRTLARIDLGRMGRLAWGLEYQHENRRGNRPFGGSFGFNNVTEIPEPIDYDTTSAELSGEWRGTASGLRFGYRYSLFDNNISTMYWDNPFRAQSSTDPNAYLGPSSSSINGAAVGFADLAPSNRSNLLFLDGKTRFAGSWWAHGSLSYNQMKQDDPLLPYTLNGSIFGTFPSGQAFNATLVSNLPVRNADTKVDVLSFNADTGTRFAEDFSLIFRYRYYDYDNQSPRISFPGYVRFHSVWEDIPRITVPYAYNRQDLGAELTWDLFQASRLGLGYRIRSWSREFREVEDSDEDVITLSFDSQPRRWFNIRTSYELGDRTIDEYVPEAAEASFLEPSGLSNNPDLRKFAQAAREYNSLAVDVDFFFTEVWSLSVGVNGRNEDYDESELGLLDDDIVQYNAEVSYTPGENLNFYLFAHRADREVFQRSRQSGGTPSERTIDNWELTLDEVNDTWGLGVAAKLTERWSTDVSGRYSRSDGAADFFAFPGGLPLSGTPPRTEATDFDNYEDIELLSLLGRLDFNLSERVVTGFWYRFEDYTIDSFIRQGLRYYLPGALLLNPENGDYQANLFGVELRLSF